MPRFIALVDFTGQGVTAIRETVERSEVFRQKAGELGVKVRDVYWTLGAHDGVLVFDADDGPTATAALLNLAKGGAVRTHCMRAFGKDEMTEILAKVA